jgi:phenol 2-monooxygenase
MNVSMADSFNLAWKLTRSIPTAKSNNIAAAADPAALLQSYATERRAVAQRLIEIDRQWYELQWVTDAKTRQTSEYQERFTETNAEIMKFVSGVGIAYSPSFLTQSLPAEPPISPDVATSSTADPQTTSEAESSDATPQPATFLQNREKFKSSPAQPGKRLANRELTRLAGGDHRSLQDEATADAARFFVIVFTGREILDGQSPSAKIVQRVLEYTLPKFNRSSTTCEAKIITPAYVWDTETGGALTSKTIAIEEIINPWARLPSCVKRDAEMEIFFMAEADYHYYGLNVDYPTILVVRPDGWVGARFDVKGMEDEAVKVVEDGLEGYLGGIFRKA